MELSRAAGLASRLELARAEYRKALAEQDKADEILHHFAGHPGGTRAVQTASRSLKAALDAYMKALSEYMDYLVSKNHE